jgi:hypothetical protein
MPFDTPAPPRRLEEVEALPAHHWPPLPEDGRSGAAQPGVVQILDEVDHRVRLEHEQLGL